MNAMISYSHNDQDTMRIILDGLKVRHISVWVDETGLRAGVDFLRSIGKAIVESNAFLALVSESYLSSRYCIDEVNLAYVSQKPIIMVCLQDKEELFALMESGQKLIFAQTPYVTWDNENVSEWQNTVDTIMQILRQETNQNDAKSVKRYETLPSSSKWYMTPKNFWNTHFCDCDSVDWDIFECKVKEAFSQKFVDISSNKEDLEWYLHLLLLELDPDLSDKVTYDALSKFCTLEEEIVLNVWSRIELYISEYLAIRAVFSMESSVRLDAIESLQKFAGLNVQNALCDLLRDRDANVRAVAAIVLARISIHESSRRHICKKISILLKDPDRLVRESACLSLGQLTATEHVNDLVKIWRNDVISTVREAALLALEKMDDPKANEAIHMTKILSHEIQQLCIVNK